MIDIKKKINTKQGFAAAFALTCALGSAVYSPYIYADPAQSKAADTTESDQTHPAISDEEDNAYKADGNENAGSEASKLASCSDSVPEAAKNSDSHVEENHSLNKEIAAASLNPNEALDDSVHSEADEQNNLVSNFTAIPISIKGVNLKDIEDVDSSITDGWGQNLKAFVAKETIAVGQKGEVKEYFTLYVEPNKDGKEAKFTVDGLKKLREFLNKQYNGENASNKNQTINRICFPDMNGNQILLPDDPRNGKAEKGVFQDCDKLERADLTNLSLKGCHNPSNFFKGCHELTQLTHLDNMEVPEDADVDFSGMFEGCWKLHTLMFGKNFNTSQVTNMSNMFKDCHSLLTLALPETFNTEKVETMESMFDGCVSLCNISFDYKGFNTSNVKNMHAMFRNCRHIGRPSNNQASQSDFQSLTFSDAFTFEKCEDLSDMFYCDKTTAITYDKKAYEDAQEILGQNPSRLLHSSWLKEIVYKKGEKIAPVEFNAQETTTTKQMFRGLEALGGHAGNNLAGKLPIVKTSDKLTDCSGMFEGCYNMGHAYSLTPGDENKTSDALDVRGINLANVTDTSRMFKGCYYLQDAFGTLYFVGPKVTKTDEMFSGCCWMKVIDLQGFNPDNLQSMDGMFADLVDASIIKLNKLNNENASKKDVFKHIPHKNPSDKDPDRMVTTYFTGQITLGKNYKFADNAGQNDVPYKTNMPVLYTDDPVPEHPTITVDENAPVQAANGFHNDLAHRVDLKEDAEKDKVHTWLLAQTIEVVDEPSIQTGYIKRIQFKQGDDQIAKLEAGKPVKPVVNTSYIATELDKVKPQHKNIKIRDWDQLFEYSKSFPDTNSLFYQLVPKYSATVQFKDPLAKGSQLLYEYDIPYETDSMQYSFIAAGHSVYEPSSKPNKKFIGYKLVGGGDTLYQPSDFTSYADNRPPLIKDYVKPDEGPSQMVFEAQYEDVTLPPATAVDSGNVAIGGMLVSSIVLGLAGFITGKKYFTGK